MRIRGVFFLIVSAGYAVEAHPKDLANTLTEAKNQTLCDLAYSRLIWGSAIKAQAQEIREGALHSFHATKKYLSEYREFPYVTRLIWKDAPEIFPPSKGKGFLVKAPENLPRSGLLQWAFSPATTLSSVLSRRVSHLLTGEEYILSPMNAADHGLARVSGAASQIKGLKKIFPRPKVFSRVTHLVPGTVVDMAALGGIAVMGYKFAGGEKAEDFRIRKEFGQAHVRASADKNTKEVNRLKVQMSDVALHDYFEIEENIQNYEATLPESETTDFEKIAQLMQPIFKESVLQQKNLQAALDKSNLSSEIKGTLQGAAVDLIQARIWANMSWKQLSPAEQKKLSASMSVEFFPRPSFSTSSVAISDMGAWLEETKNLQNFLKFVSDQGLQPARGLNDKSKVFMERYKNFFEKESSVSGQISPELQAMLESSPASLFEQARQSLQQTDQKVDPYSADYFRKVESLMDLQHAEIISQVALRALVSGEGSKVRQAASEGNSVYEKLVDTFDNKPFSLWLRDLEKQKAINRDELLYYLQEDQYYRTVLRMHRKVLGTKKISTKNGEVELPWIEDLQKNTKDEFNAGQRPFTEAPLEKIRDIFRKN